MKPLYPSFKKLTIDDKEAIESYTADFLPYSDYNLFSILTYDVNDEIVFSYLNKNLVVRFNDYVTNKKFYSFLGTIKIEETIEILLRQSKSENLDPVLKLIPSETIASILPHNSRYIIEEDQDNFDYIYSIKDLFELKNKYFHGQKNLINQFTKVFPSSRIMHLNLTNKRIQEDIIQLFKIWERNAKKSHEETEHEFIAIQRALRFAQYFQTYAIGIYDKNILIGFIISNIAPSDHFYAQSHFAKFNKEYRGVFAMLFYNLSVELYNQNLLYINNEQDLGILGLRNAKQQWHPSHFLKKYIISEK